MATKQKFTVWIKEVWCHGVVVEAESADAAIDAAWQHMDAYPEPGFFEYSHTLDPETWTIESQE